MIADLVKKNRSYRRFCEDRPVAMTILKELIELGRLSPSGGNLQPIKYVASCDPERNAVIFDHLAWAGYLTDWEGPEKGERPAAYIILLGDSSIKKNFGVDAGLSMQSILIGAVEKGLGGCIFGSIQRAQLREALGIQDELEILYVVALGYPKETVVIETIKPDGSLKYWRDEKAIHHVPKRPLSEVLIRKWG
jgi:nitroreductase